MRRLAAQRARRLRKTIPDKTDQRLLVLARFAERDQGGMCPLPQTAFSPPKAKFSFPFPSDYFISWRVKPRPSGRGGKRRRRSLLVFFSIFVILYIHPVVGYMPRDNSNQKADVVRVLRLRLKDKHAAILREKSYWVNQLWNYCNEPASTASKSVGIDLGLKAFATCSDGLTIDAEKLYRQMEPKLAMAQRAGKKRLVKPIHAKIANKRKEMPHQLSTRLVREHGGYLRGSPSRRLRCGTVMVSYGPPSTVLLASHAADRKG